MKLFIKILGCVILGFILIQFIPVNQTQYPVDEQINFVSVEKTPQNVAVLLKNACYDCHSNETVYPEYAAYAPISWSIENHVKEGREHLNFSIWKNYNQDLKETMLKKSIQTIQNRSMPMPGYIVYHPQANLSSADRALLVKYFSRMLEE